MRGNRFGVERILVHFYWHLLHCVTDFLKGTIDEYDHFLYFWGGESKNGIRFYPSHLDFAIPEVAIFT